MNQPAADTLAPIPVLENLPVDPGDKLHIPELDGLRGIAILLVLVHHFTPVYPASDSHLVAKLLFAVAAAGWMGVDLFFVLSGFLITRILLHSRGRSHYFRNFYARRTLRIFPLYYGVLVCYFILVPAGRYLAGHSWAPGGFNQTYCWLYVSNIASTIANVPSFRGIGHFWSLAVEEQFYLVWPAVILLAGRRGLPWVAGFAIVESSVASIWCMKHGFIGYKIYEFTPTRLQPLAIGAILTLAAGYRGRRDLARIFRVTAAISIIGIAIIAIRRHGFDQWDWPVQLYGFPLVAVLFCSCLGICLSTPHDAPLRRALRFPPLVRLARYSYGVYVYHEILRAFLLPPLPSWIAFTHSPILGGAAFLFTGTALSLALAVLSWHYYEQHFLRLKRFFSR